MGASTITGAHPADSNSSHDVEAALLGAALIDPPIISEVMDLVSADDFSTPENRAIFAAMCELYLAGERPDIVTVAARLNGAGDLSQLSLLATACPDSLNFKAYAKSVAEASRRRQIASSAAQVIEAVQGNAGGEELDYRLAALATVTSKGATAIGAAATWLEPEDRGRAVLSEMGGVEYVEDFVRPGRIVVVAAEEGTGKSYAIDDELAIRVSVAGGSFAETWPVLQTGPVLVLSEMHTDDDFEREETALASLNLKRSDLDGHYFRLPLMTAAGGKPVLTEPEWMRWVTGWLRDHKVLVMIVDTATTASNVDPWGEKIQAVYAALRGMLAEYPALAITLIVHLKKPQGRGERRLSDVLGEWGRWNDVTVLMENDGASLDRCKITVRKRVRHERRIVATKHGGLLVDALDADTAKSTKVPPAEVLAAVVGHPGATLAELGQSLGVSKDTAGRYVATLVEAGRVETRSELRPTVKGLRSVTVVYPTADGTSVPPQTTAHAAAEVSAAVTGPLTADTAVPPQHCIGAAVSAAEVSDVKPVTP
jgi:DNA-binding MarR family transcriptional regulator